MTDATIPILPCRDLDESIAFYARLGFDVSSRYPSYAIVRRDALELHLFPLSGIAPLTSATQCYARVADARRMHAEMSASAGLPEAGVPRLAAVRDEPWGMREFHVVDPSGNLFRIGQDVGRNLG